MKRWVYGPELNLLLTSPALNLLLGLGTELKQALTRKKLPLLNRVVGLVIDRKSTMIVIGSMQDRIFFVIRLVEGQTT